MTKASDNESHALSPDWWTAVVAILPKIKNPLQLVGFLSLLGSYLAYREIPQQLIPGALIAGIVGGAMLFLGMVFHLSEKNKELQKPIFIVSILTIYCLVGFAFFVTALRYLIPATLPPTHSGPSEPSRPLPDDIDFVDAEFIEEANPDPRGSTLDIRFTNQGSKTAFVKQLALDVKRVWHLKQPPTGAGAVVGPSATYQVKLEEEKVPYEAKVRVSNSVESGQSDEFHLLIRDVREWSEVYTIYRFSLVLISNSSDHRTPYKKDFLVFFSEYGNSFPTVQEALRMNQLQRMPPETVTQILEANRSTLREIATLKDCVMSPVLRSFIESAGRP
ncbi:hypothetical protein SAMN05444166_1431 [Singulisphaera sp. GP187]|uniref:hypothetical protein n=1 Tax=Singulisphaera sp. GP187 TaxID=1882752 RepID=UPI00092CBFF7|nr:hypothetical protein [Singulisphaera sp. GP187]SIN88384.1 hypothetical protein SAMN05444166_1431 [Singulisphaera sp. GP187]